MHADVICIIINEVYKMLEPSLLFCCFMSFLEPIVSVFIIEQRLGLTREKMLKNIDDIICSFYRI